MSENTPAKRNITLPSLLGDKKQLSELTKALPQHIGVDQFSRFMLTYYRLNEGQLSQCNPLSLYAEVLTAAQIGLPIDGRMAHLVKFGSEAKLILDYKGLKELARRSGRVKSLQADVVCENDDFAFGIDSSTGGSYFKFVPNLKDRGEIIGAFSYAVIDDEPSYEYMTMQQINAVKSKSRSANSSSSPWKEFPAEMYKKTVTKRHLKHHSFSPEFNEAIEVDNNDIDLNGKVEVSGGLNDLNQEVKKPKVIEPPPPEEEPPAPKPKKKKSTAKKPVVSAEDPPEKGSEEGELVDNAGLDKNALLDQIHQALESNELEGVKAIKKAIQSSEGNFELSKWRHFPVELLNDITEELDVQAVKGLAEGSGMDG